MDPTESELIEALQQAQNVAGTKSGSATATELSKALGWPPKKTREALLALKEQKLLGVGTDYRKNLAGRTTRVPVYWLVTD